MICSMQNTDRFVLCFVACCLLFLAMPAQAFTADSLDISIQKNGDAVATFRFTLEGFIENAIPQSLLEEELKKGLSTSGEPADLISMDRSTAVLLLKKFAATVDVPTGTEYRTSQMDFRKAEVALQNSAISGVVTADFSPARVLLTFPDSYEREFSSVEVLPSVTHTVVDLSKTPVITAAATGTPVPENGSLNVTSTPPGVQVMLDGQYIGEAPGTFPDVPAGTHALEFRRDGYESASKPVTILAGKTTNVMVVLRYLPQTEEPALSPSWPGLVLPLLILAAIIIAGYVLWMKKKKQDEATEEPETPAEDGDDDTEEESE